MPGVGECLLSCQHFALALLISRLSLAETAKLTASALIKRGIKGVFPARVRSRRECTAIPVRKRGGGIVISPIFRGAWGSSGGPQGVALVNFSPCADRVGGVQGGLHDPCRYPSFKLRSYLGECLAADPIAFLRACVARQFSFSRWSTLSAPCARSLRYRVSCC
jgi:hypothetical protein